MISASRASAGPRRLAYSKGVAASIVVVRDRLDTIIEMIMIAAPIFTAVRRNSVSRRIWPHKTLQAAVITSTKPSNGEMIR